MNVAFRHGVVADKVEGVAAQLHPTSQIRNNFRSKEKKFTVFQTSHKFQYEKEMFKIHTAIFIHLNRFVLK